MSGFLSFLKESARRRKKPLFGKRKFDDEITHKYTLLGELGTGGFSEVRVGRNLETGKKYAVKCILKKSLDRVKEGLSNVENEASILSRIKHKNVIKLIELIDNRKSIYLVMDLVAGGELFDQIVIRGAYSEQDASDITKQVLAAMSYIHSLGIVHRDLKPENLLYDSRQNNARIIVTDFGLAKYVKDLHKNTTLCGTPGYVAPEVLLLKSYGILVDCWGIGVITYILLCGYPPFYDEENRNDALTLQIVNGTYTFHSPYWDNISSHAKEFITNLLQVDPGNRTTCDEALKHAWLKNRKELMNSLCVSGDLKQQHHVRVMWKKAFIATNFIKRMLKLRVLARKQEEKYTAF